MENITGEEFEKLVYSEDAQLISNYIVQIHNRLNINLNKVNLKITFSNITFSRNTIKFYKREEDCLHIINFENCIFLSDINFDYCNIQELNFTSNVFNCNNLKINNSKIFDFSFKEINVIEKGNIEIYKCEVESCFEIEKIRFIEFSKLIIKESTFNCTTTIMDCEINQLVISHCFFKEHFDYFGNKSNSNNNSYFFNRCEFNYSSFFKTKFNNDSHFADCKFLNITKFENTGDEIKTILRFDDCEFLKQVSFNKSRIHKISFNNLKFLDEVSLQETYFDIVEIDRTIFEKQANFDEIQIKQIYNCNRKTIRTIKLQLQKAENKIDYNKFRVYEFNAYRADIKRKLKEFKQDKDQLNHRKREPIQLKRDAFVLWISDVVSEYGTDWKRAFNFTFWSGMLIYLFFYSIENYNQTIDVSNWDNWKRLISGFFRFFLVTDFYNPLENDRIYIKNPLSWIIFIFGKVVIAFGIYEIIQSFRKFKA